MSHVISSPAGEVPVLMPSAPDSAAKARAGAGPCVCRVEGTVEIEWSQPLPHPLRVVVSLFDLPAVRDTVELFMGSPRTFVLRDVPCGAHRVVVGVPEHERFVLATPESERLVECDRGPRAPMRLVLIRR